MWFPGSRRAVYVYVAVLIVVVLQIVGAIRVFPAGGNAVGNVEFSRRIVLVNKSKHDEDLFNKYLRGTRRTTNTTQTAFDETKRRVPSCPDPLHN